MMTCMEHRIESWVERDRVGISWPCAKCNGYEARVGKFVYADSSRAAIEPEKYLIFVYRDGARVWVWPYADSAPLPLHSMPAVELVEEALRLAVSAGA